jgi:hypothetical protein
MSSNNVEGSLLPGWYALRIRRSSFLLTSRALGAFRHRPARSWLVGWARRRQADIFLYRERREYLDALNHMCAGLESARVALVKARQRLDRER